MSNFFENPQPGPATHKDNNIHEGFTVTLEDQKNSVTKQIEVLSQLPMNGELEKTLNSLRDRLTHVNNDIARELSEEKSNIPEGIVMDSSYFNLDEENESL